MKHFSFHGFKTNIKETEGKRSTNEWMGGREWSGEGRRQGGGTTVFQSAKFLSLSLLSIVSHRVLSE